MSCNNDKKNEKKDVYYWSDGFWTYDKEMADTADKFSAFGDGTTHQTITINPYQHIPEVEVYLKLEIYTPKQAAELYAQREADVEAEVTEWMEGYQGAKS